MMRRPPAGAKGQRPTLKGSGATLKRLLKYVTGPYKVQMCIVIVCILMSAVTVVMGARFLETLIDDYIKPLSEATSPDFSGMLRVILTMAGVYLAGILCSYLYNRMMVTIAQGVLKRVRDSMFEHMQHLPIKYFDTNTHGDVMSRYTNDTDTLRQFIAQSLPQLVNSVITATSVLVFMCMNNLLLTGLTILTVVFMVFVTGRVAGMSGKYFVEQQKSLGAVNGYIEEMINGQKVVKVFCHEDKVRERFCQLNDELCDNATRANQYGNIIGPIMNNLGHLQYVLIAIAGGAIAIGGVMGMTLGKVIAFLQLSRSFTNPVTQMSQQMNMVAMALAGAKRIFQLMDEPVETDEGYVTLVNAEEKDGALIESERRTGLWAWRHKHSDGTVTLTRLQGDVRLQDVDFEYTEGKPVLHDITLYAEPGQKVAFVGATGAGKTTITNLINRFYDIADGKIRYDGININKIRKDDLRRSLGIVLQDVNLFTDTVMENIRYGKLDASDQDVIDAAKRAGAHDFIMMLPSGYQTVLTGDGSGLSQGQRQLLSIARAAVADPPVMILDEATSSIDTRTEAIVQRGMDALMQGRTVFVIAHRLSTVQNADVIMVLEQGRIIERGSHEKLIAEGGKYYQLYTGAFELE